IIKFLRMNKSKLQIPLNQKISKVIILANKDKIKEINDLSEDIKNTVRIGILEIKEKSSEITAEVKPDLEQGIEELDIGVRVFK
ncbi:hypothetical protein LCGC14_2722120, partial [marine sediment metagenome]